VRTLTAAVSNCLILGVLSVASAAPGDQIYARPGQLISVQGTRLNFYCMGRGSPTAMSYAASASSPRTPSMTPRFASSWKTR
jgi:hypothetical protein